MISRRWWILVRYLRRLWVRAAIYCLVGVAVAVAAILGYLLGISAIYSGNGAAGIPPVAAVLMALAGGAQLSLAWRENQKATLLACQLAWPFRAAVGGFARVQLIASILAPTSRGPRSYLSFDRTADVSIEVETKCPSRA